MENKNLNQEFRPKYFGDVIGQGDTPDVLRNQVAQNKLGHAYLLTGNRGSGKTTTGRILAKASNCLHPVNGEPCDKCENCRRFDDKTMIDFFELDGATHKGIDNIRNIINDIQYAPQLGKYKVFLIDEVHALTGDAVTAFLKTLEEPPKYVKFILCTTDPQKLPITILSRCQRFDFKRIKIEDILGRLRYIVREKSFNIEDKALHLIAKLADGAMRDSLELLGQAVSLDAGKGVTYSQVASMLGISSNEKILSLQKEILSRNTIGSLEALKNIVDDGKDLYIFLQDLIKGYRNVLMAKVDSNCENLISASDAEINNYKKLAGLVSSDTILHHIRILQDCEKDFKFSSNQRTMLEMSIVKMTGDTNENLLLKKINELQNVINNMLSSIQPDTYVTSISPSNSNDIHENGNSNFHAPAASVSASDDLYAAEIALQEKLRNAKQYVIEKILEANRAFSKGLSETLNNSELSLEEGTLYICSNENDCETLITYLNTLTKGFKATLGDIISVEVILD